MSFKPGEYVYHDPTHSVSAYGEPKWITNGSEAVVEAVDGSTIKLRRGSESWWVMTEYVNYSPFQLTIFKTEMQSIKGELCV